MRIAVLGTGAVGRTLAPAFVRLGHEVRVGTRDPAATREREDWTLDVPLVPYGEVADAAELVVNATNGQVSLDALSEAGADALAGVVLLDVANPLDFSAGFPPTLTVKDTDSLAEQIQRAYPGARVVKALNTVNAGVMVDPKRVGDGGTTMFLAGDDAEARALVAELLRALGWRDIIEFEQLSAARGMEMWLPLWVRLMGQLGTADFNLRIVRREIETSP
ncbi:MAG TPA: NAD(P)-binding domain-containing protein [Nocardioidaceae bacterium]|jgi:predicted dinucleotide-binding enzyme|nr:NAD(P)-binding domain-containing protein [Nocardioidaceae bacterium]